METWLVPGAHLELAPVFFGAAFLLSAGLLRAARRRRSPKGLASDLTRSLASDLPADVPAD